VKKKLREEVDHEAPLRTEDVRSSGASVVSLLPILQLLASSYSRA
jgi:hypothetical protein